MGVYERSVERQAEYRIPERLQIPAVDHEYVDPGSGGDIHAHGVEDAGFRGTMFFVDDLAQFGDGHPLYPLGIGVLAGIIAIHGIDGCGVDYPVRTDGLGYHGGNGIRRVSGRGSAHDGYGTFLPRGDEFLDRLRDPERHIAE